MNYSINNNALNLAHLDDDHEPDDRYLRCRVSRKITVEADVDDDDVESDELYLRCRVSRKISVEVPVATIYPNIASLGPIKGVFFSTYARSNSPAGAYGLFLLWEKGGLEKFCFCPCVALPDLDRRAVLAAFKLMERWRQVPGIPLRQVDDYAKLINARRPKKWRKLPGGSPVRERFRGGLLQPYPNSKALSCALTRRSPSAFCQELAVRSYRSQTSSK